MLFKPTTEEYEKFAIIAKYSPEEFALVRMTPTMMEKSIIDASKMIRGVFLKGAGIDYDQMGQGRENGSSHEVLFLHKGQHYTKMSVYRPKTKKGDPRFWLYGAKKIGLAKTGDMLYLSTFYDEDKKQDQIWIANLTSGKISEETLSSLFGADLLNQAVTRLIPKLKEIAQLGYYPNAKGPGKTAPKDVGETLETLLDIKSNSSKKADFEGLIEVKAKRSLAKTNDTLFSMVPNYNLSKIKSSNEMILTYGYPSTKYEGFYDLYLTVGNTPNKQGLFLVINEEKEEVQQHHTLGKVLAIWKFDEIKKRLFEKHRSTIWVLADEKNINGTTFFHYNKAQLSRKPLFSSFITLIHDGQITFDWRGRVCMDGTGYKDKGHAWRMKPRARELLFGELKAIDLSKGVVKDVPQPML